MTFAPATKAMAIVTTVCAVATPAIVIAQSYDNMYPTGTYLSNCSGQSVNNGAPCQQDGSNVTLFIQNSLSQTGGTNVLLAIGWEFDPTDLTLQYQDPPVYTHTTGLTPRDYETDIIYQMNGGILPGFWGMTWCDVRSDFTSFPGPVYRKCDQTYIAFSSPVFPTGTPSTDIACHESGHAVGLVHGTLASPVQSDLEATLRCMRQFSVGDDYLGSWNQAQINTLY